MGLEMAVFHWVSAFPLVNMYDPSTTFPISLSERKKKNIKFEETSLSIFVTKYENHASSECSFNLNIATKSILIKH